MLQWKSPRLLAVLIALAGLAAALGSWDWLANWGW
jgi:hypothetical protein